MATITANPFKDRTLDNILSEMMAQLPATGPGGQPLDISVGSFIYDSLAPAAAAIAEAYIRGNLLLQYSFVDTSYGEFLDAIVSEHGATRKVAVQAVGTLTFTGVQATIIPLASKFSTLADISGNVQVFQTNLQVQIQPRNAGVGPYQETDPSIVYTGTWNADATTKYSAVVNDYASIFINGTSITVRTAKGTDQGKIAWSVDGGVETIVDLYNAGGTITFDLVIGSLSVANHTIKLRVETKNGASSANTVRVDYYTLVGGTTGQILDTVSVAVTAVNGGKAGNVGSATITRLVSPLTGITVVTNATATSSGTDTETDAELKIRFKDFVSNPPSSGNIADYKRWAVEADVRVGNVDVLPLWSGAGTVKVFVLDTLNAPASAPILAAVQAYIDPTPVGTGAGKAPIGATVTVVAPTTATIDVNVTLTLLSGYDATSVKVGITAAITKYIASIGIAGTIRYNDIANSIHDTGGVQDFSALQIRKNAVAFGTANIVLAAGEKGVANAFTYS